MCTLDLFLCAKFAFKNDLINKKVTQSFWLCFVLLYRIRPLWYGRDCEQQNKEGFKNENVDFQGEGGFGVIGAMADEYC